MKVNLSTAKIRIKLNNYGKKLLAIKGYPHVKEDLQGYSTWNIVTLFRMLGSEFLYCETPFDPKVEILEESEGYLKALEETLSKLEARIEYLEQR